MCRHRKLLWASIFGATVVDATFLEEGPIGITFGADKPGQQPYVQAIQQDSPAARTPGLAVRMPLLSVNGQAAISNVQAVQMLRDACGPVVLAVRDTTLAASSGPAAPPKLTGLKVLNPQ